MKKEQRFTRYAVVMGLVPPGLSVVRELGKKEVPVCGITKKHDHEIGKYSRYLGHVIAFEQFDALLNELIHFAKTKDEKPILMPMRDDYLFFIADYYEELKPYFLVQESYRPESVRKIVDKKYFYQSLDACGIRYPETWYPENPTTIMDTIDDQKFPLIAKPRRIHEHMKLLRRKKVFLFNTRNELASFAETFKESLSDWLIQEIIPGPGSNIYVHAGYANRKGEILSYFTARKLKQLPEDFGVGVDILSEDNRDIETLSQKLLSAFQFQGIYETEFKWDERDQAYKVMEINPRAPLWIGLSSKAGIPINFIAYLDLCRFSQEEPGPRKKSVLWSYGEKTVIGLCEKLIRRKNGSPSFSDKVGLPPNTIRTGPIWEASDPMPAFFLIPFYMNKILKRLHMKGM